MKWSCNFSLGDHFCKAWPLLEPTLDDRLARKTRAPAWPARTGSSARMGLRSKDRPSPACCFGLPTPSATSLALTKTKTIDSRGCGSRTHFRATGIGSMEAVLPSETGFDIQVRFPRGDGAETRSKKSGARVRGIRRGIARRRLSVHRDVGGARAPERIPGRAAAIPTSPAIPK